MDKEILGVKKKMQKGMNMLIKDDKKQDKKMDKCKMKKKK